LSVFPYLSANLRYWGAAFCLSQGVGNLFSSVNCFRFISALINRTSIYENTDLKTIPVFGEQTRGFFRNDTVDIREWNLLDKTSFLNDTYHAGGGVVDPNSFNEISI
jgi:hypothetical protein